MRWGYVQLVFLFSFSVWASGPSRVAFQEAYERSMAGLPIDWDRGRWDETHFVFFAGLGGEKFKPFAWFGQGYFDNFRHELRRAGIPSEQVLPTFYPPSSRSISENARGFLPNQLFPLAGGNSQKLFLVGHSKGAAELLQFALLHPEFVQERVDAIVLISGALQGSPLANLVTGKEHRRVPWSTYLPAALAGAIVYPYMNFFYRDGIRSLVQPTAAEQLQELIERDPDSAQKIREKIFVIQTHTQGWDRSPFMWLPDAFVSAEAGEPSDGLVSVSAQLPPIEGLESVVLAGVNHFMPCPKLISFYFGSRIPAAVAAGTLRAYERLERSGP